LSDPYQGREEVIQRRKKRGVVDKVRCPFPPAIDAARDVDVVVVGTLRLLNSSFASSIDNIDVVGERISYDRPLSVVKSGVAGRPSLTNDGVSNTSPVEAVVIRALNMNEGTVLGVVIRDVNMWAI
jgi:hypothetical protein